MVQTLYGIVLLKSVVQEKHSSRCRSSITIVYLYYDYPRSFVNFDARL